MPWGYRVVRAVAAFVLHRGYRKVEVVGRERVPSTGAAIVVANHENSLVDSLALLRALPRPAFPLAKAPLFKGLLGVFLRATGAVPVFRPQDEAENEGRSARENLAVFDECRKRLRAGAALVIFPEGISHPQPKLFPIRTGAARIALDLGAPVAIVPVGLAYEPPGERRGTILARIGEPFLVDGAGLEPRKRRAAIATTTRRIESSLEALLAEAEGQGDLALLRTLATVLAQVRGAPPPANLDEEHRRLRRAARAVEALREIDRKTMEEIRVEALDFQRVLALSGVPLELLDRPYTFGRVARFLATTVPVVLLAAPLALLAAVATWPARALGDVLLLRASRAEEDVWTITRILGQALVLALFAIVSAVVLGIVVGWWAALAAFVGLPLLFALHATWRDFRVDARTRVRTFFLLAGGRFRDDLRGRRRRLFGRLEEASRRLVEAGVDLDGAGSVLPLVAEATAPLA
jgi:1-acyl-sn-glycerol-3-phosphate acyltransferase